MSNKVHRLPDERGESAKRSVFIDRVVADLRAWIAAMFMTFGVMLAVYGAFFMTDADLAKGGGLNLTLWTGVGMIVVAVLFAIWFMARPQEIRQASDGELLELSEGDSEA